MIFISYVVLIEVSNCKILYMTNSENSVIQQRKFMWSQVQVSGSFFCPMN